MGEPHLCKTVNVPWSTCAIVKHIQYRNGQQGMVSSSQPTNAVTYFTAPRSRAQRPPAVKIGNTLLPVQESVKFLGLWWDSHLSFKKHISVLKTQCKEALNLVEWLLIWSGEETETHFWCCTGPLFAPSWTMVALCMAQRRTPIYDNWTASITLDWDWHWEHSAPAQCPACTQRPSKLLWRNVG